MKTYNPYFDVEDGVTPTNCLRSVIIVKKKTKVIIIFIIILSIKNAEALVHKVCNSNEINKDGKP